MRDGVLGRRLFSLAELNHLRIEAINLYEQCLTNGDATPLVEFIEQQTLHKPPRLQFLREFVEDIQQRLASLKEYRFDVRERVVRALSEGYGVDITPLTPPSELVRYHHLTTENVLSFVQSRTELSTEDALLLRKMIEASLQMAAQLHSDIELTETIHALATDWLDGMNVEAIKRHWDQHPSPDNAVIRYH